MPVLSQCVVAFDERRASPASNVGTLGATGDVTWTGTKRLVADTTAFVYLPGVAGNYLSVPDAAALDITGDLEIVARVALDDWTPAALQVINSKWNGAASGNSWYLAVNTAGTLFLAWTEAGTTLRSATSTVAPTITDGSALWVKVTLDVDNGGQSRVQFFTAADQATEPSSWTQLGSNRDGASGVTNIVSGPANVECGTRGSGTLNPLAGNVHRAIVRDGIGGSTVLDVDTSVLTDDGATSFTATTGQTVTINRSTGATYKTEVVVPGRPSRILNGTSDYGEVADNAALDFGASDSFTVWALIRRWDASSTKTIIAKKTARTSGTVGYNLYGQNVTWFQVADGSVVVNANDTFTTGAVEIHAGVRSVAADTVQSIVGGTAGTAATDTTTGTLANSEALRFGRLSGASTEYFDGRVYAWGIYPGVMTATQLATLKTELTGADTSVGPRVATLSVPTREVALSVDSREVALSVPTRTLELTV